MESAMYNKHVPTPLPLFNQKHLIIILPSIIPVLITKIRRFQLIHYSPLSRGFGLIHRRLVGQMGAVSEWAFQIATWYSSTFSTLPIQKENNIKHKKNYEFLSYLPLFAWFNYQESLISKDLYPRYWSYEKNRLVSDWYSAPNSFAPHSLGIFYYVRACVKIF